MKTKKNIPQQADCLRLLVLVPHRDSRLLLRRWSAALFAAGLENAWSFPWVAPLALLKRPLSGESLKHLARTLRQYYIIDQNGGKLTAGPPAHSDFLSGFGNKEESGAGLSVFGPSLPLKLSDDFYESVSDTIIHRIEPLVLGTALLHGPLPDGLPIPPQITFRAAALANMSYRSLPLGDGGEGGYLSEWKIGKLHWLPSAI